MNPKLFRQVAVDRLSSPEQLDQVLRVTSLRSWLALFAMLGLVAALIFWGFFGTVVTTAPGTGVIVRTGGVLNVVSNGSGVLLDVDTQAGATLRANQVIAHVSQPALAQELLSLKGARDEASKNRNLTLQVGQFSSRLKLAANVREDSNIRALIEEYHRRVELVDKQITTEQELFSKGLVTRQRVLDLQQKRVDLNDEIAASEAHLKQLDADRYTLQHEPEQNDQLMNGHVSEIDRKIALLQQQMQFAQQVTTPFEGQVLEVKALPGTSVAEGQPVISLQPNQKSLQLVAYVSSSLAKDLQQGMDVEISPSNVKREEYGFMRGKVLYVADYPATPAAIMRNFENDTLVHTLSSAGATTELIIALKEDPKTATRFSWSSSQGPDQPITAGTLCQVDVITRQQHPVALIFPYLHRKAKS